MTTRLNPYLSFEDDAKQAMEFYRSVFGGELTMSTFDEFGAAEDPADGGKIMHAQLESPNGLVLMASDTPSSMVLTPGTNFAISLSGEDERELRGYWDQLATDGNTTMPLERAPWGDTFGMCIDKFGISWLVNIAGARPS